MKTAVFAGGREQGEQEGQRSGGVREE